MAGISKGIKIIKNTECATICFVHFTYGLFRVLRSFYYREIKLYFLKVYSAFFICMKTAKTRKYSENKSRSAAYGRIRIIKMYN